MPEFDLKNYITPNACQTTLAGWIWYCDSHATHGNADSAEEADWVATSHMEFFCEDIDGLPESECAVYIIDVSNNITYNCGEDYNDKTPNAVVDLDKAQQIRTMLGLP
jgi:hypothetical protein